MEESPGKSVDLGCDRPQPFARFGERDPFQRGTKTYLVLFSCMAIFLVAPAVWLIACTFDPDSTPGGRPLVLAAAALLLALPARVAFVVLRRRRKTGLWSVRSTPEERIQLAAKWSRPVRPWLKKLATAIWIVAAALWMWGSISNLIRSPRSVTDWLMAVVWSWILAGNIWSYVRKSKRTCPSPSAAVAIEHLTDTRQDPPSN
jgi:hypothetical protein